MTGAPFTAENVPVIDTARLRLRRHRIDDFAACAAMWGDPRVTQYIGGKAFTREEVWARLLRYVGHWTIMGFGFWAIEERATDRFVGEIGFADFKRDIDPPLENVAEAGWALAVEARGKGYATEALRAAISWGDEHIGRLRKACLIDNANHASIRVAEKCEFSPYRDVVYKGAPGRIYAREG